MISHWTYSDTVITVRVIIVQVTTETGKYQEKIEDIFRHNRTRWYRSFQLNFPLHAYCEIIIERRVYWVRNAMIRERKMMKHIAVIFLFIDNVFLANAVTVDHKCSTGGRLTVLWWGQEPYIYKSADKQEDNLKSKVDAPTSISGMFPLILDQALERCCKSSTTLNYTQVPEGPAGLDQLLAAEDFDLILPVGAEVGAGTVRQFSFTGLLESPGVAVLIKGNVSGAQLLLSVLQGWPILVFILISASLAGVVIWLFVSNNMSYCFDDKPNNSCKTDMAVENVAVAF